jgi:hypothetical protein
VFPYYRLFYIKGNWYVANLYLMMHSWCSSVCSVQTVHAFCSQLSQRTLSLLRTVHLLSKLAIYQDTWQTWLSYHIFKVIKIDLKGMQCKDLDWINLANSRAQWLAVVNVIMQLLFSLKTRNYYISDWMLGSEEEPCNVKLIS